MNKMKVAITKSGNSATLRIPPPILKEMDLSIGEELDMSVSETKISFEKQQPPRAGWFENVSPIVARIESEIMELEFGRCQSDCMDDWEHGEQW